MLSLKNKKSFTLIEMLIVVVIIGILAGVLVPRLIGARERASDAGRTVKIKQTSTAIDIYAQDHDGKYPIASGLYYSYSPALEVKSASISPLKDFFSFAPSAFAAGGGYSTVADVANQIGPYMTSVPTDPGRGIAATLDPDHPYNTCVSIGDSFGYSTDTGGTTYAITSIMESKKGNTSNCIGLVDSNSKGNYQVVGKGLKYAISDSANGGEGGVEGTGAGIYYVGDTIVIRNNTTRYVIADKNLGATVAGTGVSSYGNHYQRGNNYGFPYSTSIYTPNSKGPVDTSGYNENNPYESNIFRIDPNAFATTSYNWSTRQNDKLRPEKAQGPCPSGYHIPAQAELQGLINIRKTLPGKSISNGTLFSNDLKLPIQDFRQSYDASLSKNTPVMGRYWSSTPNSSSSYSLAFSVDGVYIFGNGRASGLHVRCFKN